MKYIQQLHAYIHGAFWWRTLHQRPRIFFPIFVLLSAIVYSELLFSFFQQDEWFTMGKFYAQGIGRAWHSGFIQSFLFGLGRPLGVLTNYIFFTLFRFNAIPIALFTIVMHGAVVYLFYRYLLRESVSKGVACILSILFLTSSVAVSSVTWFAASATVLPSMFFILLSMHRFTSYLDYNKRADGVLAFVFFYIAFLYKEVGAFMGIYFAVQYYLKYKNVRVSLLTTTPFVFFSFMLVVRFIGQQIVNKNHAEFYISSQSGGMLNIILHAIVTVIASVSQALVYQTHMYTFVNELRNYAIRVSSIMQFIQLESMVLYVSVTLSLALVIGCVIAMTRAHIRKRQFFLGVVLYICLLLPHLLVRKPNSYMELRFYYALVPPLLLVLSSIRFERLYPVVRYIAGVVTVFVIICNTMTIKQIIHRDSLVARERKNIVSSFDTYALNASKKNIFFIESDEDYIVDNQVLPFQQGIGYTLMVIFFRQGVIPKSFFMSEKLWDMGSQGVESNNEYAFGYFSDKKVMHDSLVTKPLLDEYNLIHVRYTNGNVSIEPAIPMTIFFNETR